MAVDVGTGSTITFQSGFFAQILSINHSGWSREVIDTTHMGTTVKRTKMPSDLQEPGQLEIEVLFDPDTLDATETAMAAAAETVTVTYPTPSGGMGGATKQASGFLVSAEEAVPLEDRMTATYTVQFSDEFTMADST